MAHFYVLNKFKFVLQVLKTITRPTGTKFTIPLHLVRKMFCNTGQGIIHDLGHLQIVVTLGGNITDRIGRQRSIDMGFSIITGVFLKNLVQNFSGVFLAITDAAVERHHILGRIDFIIFFSVVQLGLLHQQILLRNNRLYMDVHADTVYRCLCIVHIQFFQSLSHQICSIYFSGIHFLSIRGIALFRPGTGILNDCDRGVLLNMELGDYIKQDACQH